MPFMMPVEMSIDFITDAVQQSMHQPDLLCDHRMIITVLSAKACDQSRSDTTYRSHYSDHYRCAIHQPDL
jgi:hypothetical protein